VSGGGTDGPRAVSGWAGKESGSKCLPHRAAARMAVRGPQKATGQKEFLCFYLQNTVFNCFCSDFEQISNSFLYSNYSNKNFV
jgi:hypothetical protein